MTKINLRHRFPDDAEQAAWNYISEYNLSHSRAIRSGKIRVRCPEATNHKSGVDRDKDAFINVHTGLVYCMACQKMVGQTYSRQQNYPRVGSQLIRNADSDRDMELIKKRTLF